MSLKKKNILMIQLWVVDAVTGEEFMVITSRDEPTVTKMNNESVFSTDYSLWTKEMQESYIDIKNTVIDILKKYRNNFPKGDYQYSIYDLVIDMEGNVVYYELAGLRTKYNTRQTNTKIEKPIDAINAIDKAISLELDKIKVKPSYFDNKPTPYKIYIDAAYSIE